LSSLETSKHVTTFGEIMMRLSPPRFQRFSQCRTFDVTYGGAESNVAVALANFGVPVDYVTRLPNNDLGQACLNFLRQFGIGTNNVILGGNRIGIFFNEIGAVQRGDKVIYDRANSAIATIKPGMIDWKAVFSDTSWFHWTGITPAISQGAADVCLEAVKKAKAMGLTVSCDLNFRSKLWKYGKTAREVMSELVKYADISIGNEEDADKVFGIKAPSTDVPAGKVDAEKYHFVAERLMERFPSLKKVAITLRGSISASHNSWSGVLYDGKTVYMAPTYQITHIVDRSGAGDSFAGGLIYGILTYRNNLQRALDFAVAASCLKHTMHGVLLLTTVEEVESLMGGVISGRIQR
jgi:2-dehydro-3-deoxygluconokinase